MKPPRRGLALGLAVLVTSSCAGTSQPEVTPAPTEAADTEDTEVEGDVDDDRDEASGSDDSEVDDSEADEGEPELPTAGSRQSPLALGESRLVSEDSAWRVSILESNLDAASQILANDEWADEPAEGEVFVMARIQVEVVEDAIAAQGFDLANDGAEPWLSLFIEFVAEDGTSFDGSTGTLCYTDDMLYNQGSVYSDGALVTGDDCFAVPQGSVEGGLWRVSNSVNDSVWISSK